MLKDEITVSENIHPCIKLEDIGLRISMTNSYWRPHNYPQSHTVSISHKTAEMPTQFVVTVVTYVQLARVGYDAHVNFI